MPRRLRFALNHIASPGRDIDALASLARDLGIASIEIRNDLDGVALRDGTPASAVRTAAAAAGVAILSINALQRFEQWNAQRANEARALADYAAACGAGALVLCPTNDRSDVRPAPRRAEDLRAALKALRPILSERGLAGLIEPLGFAECSLRLKSEALAAIDESDSASTFRVLHDTFHHFVAGEAQLFPARTGLVHISGVEDASIGRDQMRDPHRVLVGRSDRIGNAGQIAELLRGGYDGPFSFEPFSPSVQNLADLGAAVRASMAYLDASVAATG